MLKNVLSVLSFSRHKYVIGSFFFHLKDLENQMDVAEKRRLTLLKDFLEIWVYLTYLSDFVKQEKKNPFVYKKNRDHKKTTMKSQEWSWYVQVSDLESEL